jgi:hypothetical protein
MIKPGPPPVFSLTLLMAQAALSAQLYPGTVGRLPVKNPEVMVDDRPIEGQSISTGNLCSVGIVIAGLRKGARESATQNTRPDKRRPEALI